MRECSSLHLQVFPSAHRQCKIYKLQASAITIFFNAFYQLESLRDESARTEASAAQQVKRMRSEVSLFEFTL